MIMTLRYVRKGDLISAGQEILQVTHSGFIIDNGAGTGGIWIAKEKMREAIKASGKPVALYSSADDVPPEPRRIHLVKN